MDESTESPLGFSVGAVELAFMEAFTEAFVDVYFLPAAASTEALVAEIFFHASYRASFHGIYFRMLPWEYVMIHSFQ